MQYSWILLAKSILKRICNKKWGKKTNKLRRINDQLITNTYVKTSVLIPFGSRACTSHFDEYGNFK